MLKAVRGTKKQQKMFFNKFSFLCLVVTAAHGLIVIEAEPDSREDVFAPSFLAEEENGVELVTTTFLVLYSQQIEFIWDLSNGPMNN